MPDSVQSAACACPSWTHKPVWHRTTVTSGWKSTNVSQVRNTAKVEKCSKSYSFIKSAFGDICIFLLQGDD